MEGHLHPITQFMRKAIKVFSNLGFEIVEGPELETANFNFDLLNFPKEHPARDMWDTFFINDKKSPTDEQKLLLRTHTSPVQIRAMAVRKPPVRIIVPGRCFRHEATDASHETCFYQLEGFAIDKSINLGNLMAVLKEFAQKIYNKNVQIRFRPSYFPFTEPSIEMDIAFNNNWQEVLGAGMVHPRVIKNMLSQTKSAEAKGEGGGLNPEEWQGFAFGMGIDRLTMLYFGISDIRLFYSGDLRFLKQF